jgi:anhydro-N-acetylmuramic acid kinase
MEKFNVIGVMSGTSMDGLDIACCTFSKKERWSYTIVQATTMPYPATWRDELRRASEKNAVDLTRLHLEYGKFIGSAIKKYIQKTGFNTAFIASHGHTVFHQPENGVTLQIGDGNAIAATAGLPVVCDFRSLDVALGGQGAPLVPVGDRMLFGEYSACLNLGGIANVSYEDAGRRTAFDVCPANMLLNHLSQQLGQPYDNNGVLAAGGKVNGQLLDSLNRLPYYQLQGSKTLGREWFEENILPIVESTGMSIPDLLRTSTEHIAYQVAHSLSGSAYGKMLVTGGGALNTYLVSRIRALTDFEVLIPNRQLVNFKEALIFAFLGILRWRNEINCLASVTGASRDSCSGVIIA